MATNRRTRSKRAHVIETLAVPVDETITLKPETLHEVLDVLDHVLRDGDEGPRLDSRGRVIWGGEWPDYLEFVLALETELKELLCERKRERAVAEAVAEALAAHRPGERL